MYPRVRIHMDRLRRNLDACAGIIQKVPGCTLMIVTKGVCAYPPIVRMLTEHPGVDFLADSRIQNLKSYAAQARQAGKQTVLLRLSMPSEVSEVVEYADVSFQSELSTIRLLDEAAGRAGKRHNVVLMIDLGDLREGIFYEKEEEIFSTVAELLLLKHIRLYGLGTNLTCYGAIIPKNENLSLLVGLARKLEQRFHIRLPMVSGGNSSSIYLIEQGNLPEGINNLRLGESFLLGNDTAYGTRIPGTVGDALELEAEVIEIKEKPSLPVGEIGVDAFGHRPTYEDKGIMRRAIVAVGRQDVDTDSLQPRDRNPGRKLGSPAAGSDPLHHCIPSGGPDTVYPWLRQHAQGIYQPLCGKSHLSRRSLRRGSGGYVTETRPDRRSVGLGCLAAGGQQGPSRHPVWRACGGSGAAGPPRTGQGRYPRSPDRGQPGKAAAL